MRIFISYSHRNKDILARLQVHLNPIVAWRKDVEIWDDTKITVGSKWQPAIAQAIDKCDVAILIVSADFIASEFIARNELPPLLKSAQDRGTLILPIIAAPSLFSYHPDLAQFQAINDPSKPLIRCRRGPRRRFSRKWRRRSTNTKLVRLRVRQLQIPIQWQALIRKRVNRSWKTSRGLGSSK